MKITQLEYFCATCRHHSITQAARELYVTQPAISSAIRELEKEFSINLFVRSKNHVTLTKEGELFYQKAQDMLRYIKESSSELYDLGRQTPPVRIGIPPLLSTVYFPDIYVEFSKIHPEIHLELFEYGSIRAASLVNEEALDVSLVNMDFYDIDKMNSYTIDSDSFVFCVSPEHPLAREKELTDDEKQLFTYFVKVPGMKEQLVDTLYDVQMAAADKTSKTGNIIVMGGKECGKTRLISGLIPAICKELNLEASKVAYVFADQINGKNIYKIFSKLAGGFLVIENANQLTPETVEMLDKAMEVNTDGLTVIVEDEKIGMRKLIARYPKFAKKFTSMINIPVFTNDELVNFARVYTKENGYAIDQMGMLALYNLIGINQKEDSPMNVGAVKELIDAAIAKSQGGIRKFKRNVSKKRIDRDGYIVLYEKDFTK